MLSKEPTFNQILNSSSYRKQREIIQKEVNENRFSLDRTVFHQTPEQKVEAANARMEVRKQLKAAGIPKRQYKWKKLTA